MTSKISAIGELAIEAIERRLDELDDTSSVSYERALRIVSERSRLLALRSKIKHRVANDSEVYPWVAK